MCEFYQSEQLLNIATLVLVEYFELLEDKVPGILRLID